MKKFVTLAFLLALVNGVTVNYSGNVSLSNQGDFSFRATSLASFDVGVYSGVVYKSISVDPNSVSGLFSAFYGGVLIPPTQYTTFFENAANFNGTNPTSPSLTGSSAFIGTVYLSLQEVSAAGTVIETLEFDSLTGLSWANRVTAGSGGLRTSVYAGTQGPLGINLTVVYSDVVGQLDVVGKPIITPLSTETIVEIGGWVYASVSNHLRLNMAVGTGENEITTTATGEQQLVSGSGKNAASFTTTGMVSADGNQTNVNVNFAGASVTSLKNQILAAQLVTAYKGNANVKLVSIDFPAGAKHITWDPSQGAGSNPPNNTSASSTLCASLMTIIVAYLFASNM